MALTGNWTIARIYRKKAGSNTVIEDGSTLTITANGNDLTLKRDGGTNYTLTNQLNPNDNDHFEGSDASYQIKAYKANNTPDLIVGYIQKQDNNKDEDFFIGHRNITATTNPQINASRYRLFRQQRTGLGVIADGADLIVKTFTDNNVTTKVFFLVTRTGKPVVLTTTASGDEVSPTTSEYSKLSMKVRAIDRQTGSGFILLGYLYWESGVELDGGVGTDDGDAFVAVRTGSG